jgi:hypothetical protein
VNCRRHWFFMPSYQRHYEQWYRSFSSEMV